METIEKEKQVAKEARNLQKMYKDLPKARQDLVKPLIQNAAFMKVTLEELQAAINCSGVSEEYTNGANQGGRKATPECQAYNAMLKNYQSVIMTLDKMLPADKPKSRLSALRDD